MKYTLSFLLFISIFSHPLIVAAQSAQCDMTISPTNYQECCEDSTQGDPLQCIEYYNTKVKPPAVTPIKPDKTYSPSIAIGSSAGSFSGVQFTGVGSAILGCSGASSLMADGISSAQSAVKKFAIKQIKNIFPTTAKIAKVIPGVGGAVTALSGPQAVKDEGIQNKEACLDKVARVLAQKALAQMTTKIGNWVNTGFDGNPAFVRDIDSYLKTTRNAQIEKYLPGLTDKSPIFGNAMRSIITKQVTGRSDGLLKKAKDTPQARAYQAFTKDFSDGGWSALLNNENNPLSALFISTNELAGLIDTQTLNTRSEISRNNGFLDLRTCVQYSNQQDEACRPVCTRYGTTTPGSLISSQLEAITASPIRQAELADELNEAVGSFFDNLLNQLVSKGARSFKSGGLNNKNGITTSTNIGSNYVSGEGESAFDQPEFSLGFDQNFDISRPQQIRAVLQAQHNFLNASRDTAIAAANVVPQLARLDYCMPGPTPAWGMGVEDNLESLIGNIVHEPFNGSNPGPGGKADAVVVPFPTIDPLTGERKSATTRSGMFDQLYKKARAEFLGSPTYAPGKKIRLNEGKDLEDGEQVTDGEEEINGYIRAAFGVLVQQLTSTYSQTNILTAFANTGTTVLDQAFNRGMAASAYQATISFIPYAQSVAELIDGYTISDIDTESNIAQLTAMNNEVQQIVAKAKARYIAQRAAAGNPVNMDCIDSAYEINQATVEASDTFKRLETDGESAEIRAMRAATDYFNKTL